MCLFFNNSATCRSGPFYLFNKNKILILKKNHETIAAKACMGAGEEIAGKLSNECYVDHVPQAV
jgi:hypothetical protein